MPDSEIKFPDITVKLTDGDGNGMYIIAKVRAALRQNKVPAETIDEFIDEAMSGDYDHLLQTCMRWVDVE